jgi:hypothetical protein
MPLPEFGGAMKLRQPREAIPLSVWIAFVLMAIITVIYLTGLVVLDEVMGLFNAKK